MSPLSVILQCGMVSPSSWSNLLMDQTDLMIQTNRSPKQLAQLLRRNNYSVKLVQDSLEVREYHFRIQSAGDFYIDDKQVKSKWVDQQMPTGCCLSKSWLLQEYRTHLIAQMQKVSQLSEQQILTLLDHFKQMLA